MTSCMCGGKKTKKHGRKNIKHLRKTKKHGGYKYKRTTTPYLNKRKSSRRRRLL